MSFIVDCIAVCTLVGIWPRFIAPRRVKTTVLTWKVKDSAAHLDGLKILHMSDLHFHERMPQKFLDKIVRRANRLKPDLILFTGDFICYSHLEETDRLLTFLSRLRAPLGCYCSLGNHDYAQYVSLNSSGKYDLLPPPKPLTGLYRGLKTLFSSKKIAQGVSERALSIPMHEELYSLLRKSPFTLLENSTVTLPIGLNLTGLGDFALGRCRPETAFSGYNRQFPGLILSHNPDTFPLLANYPGDWILAGHTHGEQIHLPWPKWGRKLTRKLAQLENEAYTRGLVRVGEKSCYVSRGLGCHKPIRLFSPPELCLIQVEKG